MARVGHLFCLAGLAAGFTAPAGRRGARTVDARAAVGTVREPCPGYEALRSQNWCGNVQFGGASVVPASREELADALRGGATPIRVVGRGHSFSPVAECTGGTLVSLEKLNRVLDFRPPTADALGRVTIEGGTTYTEVINFLGERGALRNLPSCPQFAVAGAVATGTHGSGLAIQNLAADVAMLEFMLRNGTTVSYDRETAPGLLEGSRVHLGCLGVVTKLALDVVPYYQVDAYRYDDVPLDEAVDALPELFDACDSLSVWTSGFGRGPAAGKAWMTFRHFEPFWGGSAGAGRHARPAVTAKGRLLDEPVSRYLTDPDAPQYYSPTARGPWSTTLALTIDDDLRETSMKATDIQSEFFVPLEHARPAIRAVQAVAEAWDFSSPYSAADQGATKGLVDAFEFRCVRGDGAWLTPTPEDALGVHTSFNSDPARRDEVLRAVGSIESALAPFGVRAHWGKLSSSSTAPGAVQTSYGDGLSRIRALCDAHDPEGAFRNAHVRRALWGEG